jgi:hypothetical protein
MSDSSSASPQMVSLEVPMRGLQSGSVGVDLITVQHLPGHARITMIAGMRILRVRRESPQSGG